MHVTKSPSAINAMNSTGGLFFVALACCAATITVLGYTVYQVNIPHAGMLLPGVDPQVYVKCTVIVT